MTSTKPSRRSSRSRLALAGGLAVFITLAGTGIANAGWTAPVVNAPASATAGAVGISQSGFASVAVQYASGVLAKTAPITVTNTGTIPAPYTLALGADVANALATSVMVNTWPVASAADCLPGSVVPGAASTSRWTTVPTLGGSLGAGAAAVWCVRTSVTAAEANPNPGESMTATLALTSNVGSWTSNVNATAVQSVADTIAPTAPGKPTASGTTDTRTTLNWTASTDFVGATGYDVYRGGAFVTTVSTTTFTDTGRSPSSSYVYTITAQDAAGNISAASAGTTVKTLLVNPASWYTIKGSSGWCLDGTGVSGATLRFQTCTASNTNQQWRIAETTTAGNYTIARQSTPTLVWSTSQNGNGKPISLVTATGTLADAWQLSYAGGAFGLTSVYAGRCLEVASGVGTRATTGNSCGTFTLTSVP